MAGRAGMVLGIDFGTSHTVAALADPDGPGRPMQFESSFLLPSAVYAELDGRLLVGRDAERSARLDPARFEPNPKRRIDDGVVLLGSREHPVPDLIAAVLRRVVDEASRVAGRMPAETVLTYPANWAASRKGILTEAAARAGIPAVTLVPEPVAAAAYFTKELGHTVPSGGALVVYDFGGGTFDTTVLRRVADDWEILATDGLTDLGGLDLDGAIVQHLAQAIGAGDPERWQRLVRPDDDLARRRHLMLWADARAAKEQLSRSSSAAIHVPLFDVDTHVTREEFERVARPYLERTVDLTMAALQRAGVRPHEVGGVFPVGGSSRIPLAGTLLHQRVGVAPTLVEDPELVVALGSVRTVTATPAQHFGAPPPFTPPAPAPVASPAPPPPRRGGRTRVGLAAAVIIVLFVCVGLPLLSTYANQRDKSNGQQPNGTGTTGTRAAAIQTAQVNKTAWYAGLKVTFGEARYDPNGNPQLSVDVSVENLSPRQYYMGAVRTTFQSGSDNFRGDFVFADQIPATKMSKGKIVYVVSKLSGELTDGAFELGLGSQAQAVIPVGKGALVSHEPQPIVTGKQVTNRSTKVTFTRCELRADFFVEQEQAEKDRYVFSCLMDAQAVDDSGPVFGGAPTFELELPDGTTVGPVEYENVSLNRAIEKNIYLAFTFDGPRPGQYTFRWFNKTTSEPKTAANTTEIPFKFPIAG